MASPVRAGMALGGLALTVVLVTGAAIAQTRDPPASGSGPSAPATIQAPTIQGPTVPLSTVPSPEAPPPSGMPGFQPGFVDAFGRWIKQSTSGFGLPDAALNSGRGMTEAASSAATNAARSTVDAARGAAEASQGVASAMGSVARDTAGALARLPGARIAVGRERCGIAPNGAPDCRFAALALCQARGFAGGKSVDIETTESCPPDASLLRWRGETVTCTTENFVTRSLCQ